MWVQRNENAKKLGCALTKHELTVSAKDLNVFKDYVKTN